MNQQKASTATLRYLPPFVRRRIEHRPQLRKILSNIGWLFFDNGLRVIMGLLVGAWIARYLGVANLGILDYARSFVALFGAFATLGIKTIVIRDLVKEPSAKEEILGTAFFLQMLGGCFIVLTTVGLTMVLQPDDILSRWLVAIIAFETIFQALYVIDFWFQSQVQSKFTVWSKSTAYLITSVFKVGAILLQAPLVVFAVAILLETVLTSVGLVINYRRRGNAMRSWQPNMRRVKLLIGESWPLALSGMMLLVYQRVDVVMLRHITGDPTAVGLYTAVSRLLDYGAFIPIVIATSLFPSLIKSKERGIKFYTKRLQQFYDLNASIAYFIILFAVPLAPFIILTLYGPEFAPSIPIFVIYVWANLFTYLGVARGRHLINDGIIKFSLFTSALGLVINVGINLVLIPQYEGVGAAIATVAAQVGAAYLASAVLLPRNSVWILQTKALVAPVRYALLGLRSLTRS